MKKDQNILNCCKVEAVVSIDERGQMVLPKEVREKAHIKAGDKLAVVTGGGQDGEVCCIALVKAQQLEEKVKNILKSLGKQL